LRNIAQAISRCFDFLEEEAELLGVAHGRGSIFYISLVCVTYSRSLIIMAVRQLHRWDFPRINQAALVVLPSILQRWLPGGKIEGIEYVCLNPKRPDRHLGSFRINMRTGKWADFAVKGARGGDVVSLGAYLFGLTQGEALRRLAAMLSIEANAKR
jgi:hypothetical protein